MTTTGEYGCHAAFNFTCASEFWGDCTFIGVMGLGKMHTEYIECVIETPYACYGTGSGIPPISKNIQNLISSEVINTGENKTFNFIGPLQVVLNELSATFTLTGGECFIEGKGNTISFNSECRLSCMLAYFIHISIGTIGKFSLRDCVFTAVDIYVVIIRVDSSSLPVLIMSCRVFGTPYMFGLFQTSSQV